MPSVMPRAPARWPTTPTPAQGGWHDAIWTAAQHTVSARRERDRTVGGPAGSGARRARQRPSLGVGEPALPRRAVPDAAADVLARPDRRGSRVDAHRHEHLSLADS